MWFYNHQRKSEPYLEFPGTLDAGKTEDPDALVGRLDEALTLETGVTMGGASLEEVISSSNVHLKEVSLTWSWQKPWKQSPSRP